MGNSAFNDLAGTRTVAIAVNFIAAAATRRVIILEHDDNVIIERVRFRHGVAITAHAANSKNLNLIHDTAAGGAATQVAFFDYDSPGPDNQALNAVQTLWTPTAAATVAGGQFAAGDTLFLECETVGTGGTVEVCGSALVDYRVAETK